MENSGGFVKSGLVTMLVLIMIFSFSVFAVAEDEEHYGGYLDEIVVFEEESAAAGVSLLEQNEIQIYGHSLTDAELFQQVIENPEVNYFQSYGSYSEISFNPGGDPTFAETGELNPFSVPRIREAMNYLVDRDYIADEIMGGLANPRYTTLATAFTDYSELITKVRELENKYAHNPRLAEEIISEEMQKLGAEKVNGIWHYDGEPVELKFVIRIEDERRQIGDYISILLEDIGFEVQRLYSTMEEATPRTLLADPESGQFHLATMGWVLPYIYRDEATTFDMMYTNRIYPFPMFQAYEPAEEFDEVAERLYHRDFRSLEERRELMKTALDLHMENSYKVDLVDNLSFTPYREEISVTGDLAAGIMGSMVWPYTARYNDRVGGRLDIALSSLFGDPWNPLDGNNSVYDLMLMEATGDTGYIADPFTGYHYPMRIERAEVFIEEGMPVESKLDWVDLEFVEENVVPDDAWVDWDPVAEEFITAAEKYPEGRTSVRKQVIYYPDDFFDKITWHDGSSISLADFVYWFILNFDRGMEESDFYDESKLADYQSFMDTFRGMKITSTDPLIIEYYTDTFEHDAEQALFTGFPNYPGAQATGAWHNLALGQLAEEKELAAFTQHKADALGGDAEWLGFSFGPSLEIMADMLAQATSENFVPFAPTLSEFLEAGEVEERWSNLEDWYEDKGHFWIGTGPYYLEAAHPVEKVAHLKRYEDHPDPADRWDIFAEPMRPEVAISGPEVLNIGNEAVFDLDITFEDQAYPTDYLNEVSYILFDTNDNVVADGQAELISEGNWQIAFDSEVTSQLATGTTRLEVITTSTIITLPTVEQVEIVTFN